MSKRYVLISRLFRQIKKLAEQVERLTLENTSLSDAFDGVEKRSAEALKKLHAELAKVNQQYNTYEEMSQRLQEANEELRAQLETSTAELRKTHQKLVVVQKQRDQLQSDLDLSREKHAQLEDTVKGLTDTIASLELQQGYIKGASNVSLEQRFDPAAEEKLARIEKEFAEIKEHDTRLDKENRHLRHQNEKLVAEVENLIRKNRSAVELGEKLVKEAETRRAEAASTQEMMQELRQKNETLQYRLEQYTGDADFVKQQLSEAFGLLRQKDDGPMCEDELDVDEDDEDMEEARLALTKNRK
jgi:chromosome segregation ATPase